MKKKKPQTSKKKVLIVSDGKRGHVHQTEGVVRKLRNVVGKKFEVKMSKPYYLFLVMMSFIARRFSFSQPLILFWIQRVTQASMSSLIKFSPDLIISAGSFTHPVTFLLSKVWDCRTVVCMRPSMLSPSDFDLVVAPRHDQKKCKGKNIIYTVGATSDISEAYIFAEAVALRPKVKGDKENCLGLLIGGNSALNFINAEMGEELIKEVLLACEENGLNLLSTTSRRTPLDVESVIRRELEDHPRNAYFLAASESDENPVPGIIGLSNSNIVIVTEDSVSMVSEIISGGRHAVVLKIGKKKKRNKFETLFEELMKENFITYTSIEELAENIAQALKLQEFGIAPLDESRRVASEIEKRFFQGPSEKGAIC